MTTDTPARDELKEFPCPNAADDAVCNEDCPVLLLCHYPPVYRAHIALRADMRKLRKLRKLRKAVLGDMTPGEAAYAYKSIARAAWNHPFLRNDQHFNILADVVEGL